MNGPVKFCAILTMRYTNKSLMQSAHDYIDEHMRYLTLPEKRPDYRGDRSHYDFLVKLCDYFGRIEGGKRSFFKEVREATAEKFELEDYTLGDALELIDSELGGIQEFYDGKCRSKVVEL